MGGGQQQEEHHHDDGGSCRRSQPRGEEVHGGEYSLGRRNITLSILSYLPDIYVYMCHAMIFTAANQEMTHCLFENCVVE
mmetsp:Transcript_26613/g.43236  ORF Transcript_26613/g.43236 Transcript_26613/m.43236 type:complete len:80 (+) Transcript_26613:67-306(+)